jgi:uncharacterized BrkB/YihY/UPF0761 family membrane protein
MEPALPRPADGRPVRRTWDVVLAIALLVVLAALAVVLGIAGAFLVMASDSCGVAGACDEPQLSAGVLVAMLGPAVVALVAIASVVERIVRSRLAFWPPLVGAAVAALVWAAGVALVFGAVPGSGG